MSIRLVLIVACVAALNGGVLAQSEADRERAKGAVVMLRTELPDGSAFGAGIVVAVKDDEIYVVTADHLVRNKGLATSIKVQFDGRRGDWFDGHRLDLRVSDLDLAVLRVAVPPKLNPSSLTAVAGAPALVLTRGSDVYPLGFRAERPWSLPVAADKIDEVGLLRVTFHSQYVRPGNSGGALLDACGRIVGMVTAIDTNASEAEAIAIESILGAMKRWSLPTSLALDQGAACGAAAAPEAERPVEEKPAPARGPRWRTHEFPPPNGGSLVFTIMPDGNPACASYNGGGCLWGVPYEQIDFGRLQPLVCGEGHRARWGVTGYDDPKHWCNLAKAVR